MTLLIRLGLLAALVVLPSRALAQAVVQYRTLSLVESAYLYSGLALQQLLRASSLRHLPQVIMVSCTIWLVYRRVTSPRPQPFAGIVAYLVSCGIILVLFWPEAAPRYTSGLTQVFPGAVTSYVAERNAMGTTDAGTSGLVPVNLQVAGGASVPRFFDLLLRVATSVPLTLGEAIDGGLERPFERVAVLDALMQQEVPASLTGSMPDFVKECYQPAMAKLPGSNTSYTFEDIVPWSTDMATQLAGIKLGANKGIFAMIKSWFGFGSDTITCDVFYQNMETAVSNHLAGEATQQGSTKQAVYQSQLGMSAEAQARFYVYRELRRHLGPAVDDPNRVTNYKRAVDAAASAIGVVGNFDWTAWGKSATGQAEKHLDRLSRFLAPASFLVYWAPWIVGIAMFAVVGFFPVVLLWSLFPGQHFKPIVNYFLLLIFVCSTPLWWAMVNAAADLAFNVHSPAAGTPWFAGVPGFVGGNLTYVVVTVLGIIMVPVMQAILLFGSWRAIGGIWHG